jgi:3-oxoacyl-[acyl-carrier protein] reductase
MARTVLITGGSRGIGKATAEVFARNGYTVIAPTRGEMDLASSDSITDYFRRNQLYVDCIINNAGINPLSPIEEMKDHDLEETININLKAPALIIRALVGRMKERSFGRIVNISSIWGVVSKEKRTVYSITKNGLHGLTNTLAVELGPHNILVNTVCPGFTNTELTKKNVSASEAEVIAADIPLRRFAEPKEIASLIYFLGSEENTYITGQKIVIDGGFTVR